MNRCKAFAEARLLATLDQVEKIRDSDFAFSDGPIALTLIEGHLKSHLQAVGDLRDTDDVSTIEAYCCDAVKAVRYFLPILAIILRSTHIRNSFEVYGPIRWLAQRLIGRDKQTNAAPCLIWSSGWDYVPMTFRRIEKPKGFEAFTFITIPATESANPMILPLAGHELGHRVWTNEGLSEKYTKLCRLEMARWIIEEKKAPNDLPDGAVSWTIENLDSYLKSHHALQETYINNATRQAEELFCDLVGYFLFGESFLHAFAYLLAPRPPVERGTKYPAIQVRVENLINAAARFKTDISTCYTLPATYDFRSQFSQEVGFTDPWLQAADYAGKQAGPTIIQEIVDLNSRPEWKQLPGLSNDRRKVIRDEFFEWGVPAPEVGSLGNLLNAAWDAENDADFWANFQPMNFQKKEDRPKFKRDALREIVLKNFEVFEYEIIQPKQEAQ